MADMICDKCIHFDAENDCCRRFPKDDGNVIEECFESAEDFVKVVRCKDCKYWYKDTTEHTCIRTGDLRRGYFYCADGEKRT